MQLSRSAVALALASGASALSGEATFYGGNIVGGHCSFSTYTLPAGLFGTATSNWENSANCGRCVSVTGPNGNAITAQIVDECPNCGTNHLDLFPDAFAALAEPSKGIIPINWQYVDCPITKPLVLHNKEGVSAYWFSIQVVNPNKGVSKLEVSTDGGRTWNPTTRRAYNFFENPSGFGTTSVSVKVTSVAGDIVIVNDVKTAPGVSVPAPNNFPLDTPAKPAVKERSVYAASPLSPTYSTSSTTRTSTTTVARTLTAAVLSSTAPPVPLPSPSIYTPSSISAPANTTSPHIAVTTSAPSNTTSYHAYEVANSSSPAPVSLNVVTTTTYTPTVDYHTVPIPIPSASGRISNGLSEPGHNITSPTSPPSFMNSASSSQSSAFFAMVMGLVALLI
ncbi:hypothetical protein B2J93_4363 [Marssonina coronariae]|uniref:Expansin-like EG45 domain-containing protein n=1 Tax=Diplocarpon coronariae TaxID=2795749 RepID=A0A218ZES5_9HELO|nr:hypothetical protein B2J93_4363 [Marssonina coronariae]